MKQVYDASKFVHVQDINISKETAKLLETASQVYSQNHSGRTWYGRCIFLSWYCSLGDCTFCFRTTQKHKIQHPKGSKRSMGSVLLEALFCRLFKWRIEFLTGGYGIMPFPQLLEFSKNISAVYGEKIWLNLGVLSENHLEQLRPYVKGICGSMETLHPTLHDEVCPSKPIAPYDKMFSNLNGFKKSIAVIVGLGDTIEDMKYLFDFVEKHSLDRVTIYALKPVPGLEFKEGPSVDYYVQWIARLRIRFPQLEIIAGTNLRRSEEVGYLMKAGASAITKFPATKQFGTKKSHLVTSLIEKDRFFISNLTELPDINWDKEINALDISEEYKQEMKDKLGPYLAKFNNPKDSDKSL
ncbi:TPA: radical SAM protein [Candidatus Woesearchaeota archaeon]|nr:radical SAM protein [archaeon]HIJ11584.1 radical SAM protein [Candidatus Woesearchaeota archaeon]